MWKAETTLINSEQITNNTNNHNALCLVMPPRFHTFSTIRPNRAAGHGEHGLGVDADAGINTSEGNEMCGFSPGPGSGPE